MEIVFHSNNLAWPFTILKNIAYRSCGVQNPTGIDRPKSLNQVVIVKLRNILQLGVKVTHPLRRWPFGWTELHAKISHCSMLMSVKVTSEVEVLHIWQSLLMVKKISKGMWNNNLWTKQRLPTCDIYNFFRMTAPFPFSLGSYYFVIKKIKKPSVWFKKITKYRYIQKCIIFAILIRTWQFQSDFHSFNHY